jgi:hypothetical protein
MDKLLNFDLSVEPVAGGGYCTRVLSSPSGEDRADFLFPFSDMELENFSLKITGSIGRAHRQGVRRLESSDRRLIRQFGSQLFRSIFTGHVQECLDRSRLAAESEGAGLRIRLRTPSVLANVPWEYIYDEEDEEFVGLNPETALVRYTEMPRPVRPFTIVPPLRILAMISAPSDIPKIQAEDEWNKLNEALRDLIREGMVKLDRLDGGTLPALQRRIRKEYHVLHFIGHGRYDENVQDGALAFEGADGKTRLVTGRDLGVIIGYPSLRLVVLNACEGARGARDDPYGGVAHALVGRGIPAVIAMQFAISDSAALLFSQSFYQDIADGIPVDVATAETRRAIFACGNEIEWATPVLYLRSHDGHIFSTSQILKAECPISNGTAGAARPEVKRQARGTADLRLLAELARLAGERGDAMDTRERYSALVQAREQVSGPEHPDTLTARCDLAYWTAKAGNPTEARNQYTALLPVLERVLGRKDQYCLAVRASLALYTAVAGDEAGARDQYAALLPVVEEVLGPEHRHTLDTRQHLAAWTGAAGDVAGARDQYAALIPACEQILGPEHAETLAARVNLAGWTATAGDAAGARDQYAALLPALEKVLGHEHPYALKARDNFAALTAAAGNISAARAHYAGLLPAAERILGPQHPGTLIARANMAWMDQIMQIIVGQGLNQGSLGKNPATEHFDGS